MAYDIECLSLARHFLDADAGAQTSLAQHIQDSIEEWFESEDRRKEPCLTAAEQKAQGERCGCRGSDDYCCCQNVPDAITRAERAVQS